MAPSSSNAIVDNKAVKEVNSAKLPVSKLENKDKKEPIMGSPLSADRRHRRVPRTRLASEGQMQDGEFSAGGTFRPKPINLDVVRETNLTPTAQQQDEQLRIRRVKQLKRRSLPPEKGAINLTGLPTIPEPWSSGSDDSKKAVTAS
jgi:hypothetical protein